MCSTTTTTRVLGRSAMIDWLAGEARSERALAVDIEEKQGRDRRGSQQMMAGSTTSGASYGVAVQIALSTSHFTNLKQATTPSPFSLGNTRMRG